MIAHFRVIARDETEYWPSPPSRQVFGLYIFREGEATYCCSLTPASWCEGTVNVGVPEGPEYEGLSDNYFTFITPPYVNCSERITVEGETDEDLWDAAREQQSSNPVEPSCVW